VIATKGRRILVLYWHPDPNGIRDAVRHHLEALNTIDGSHEVWYCNTFEPMPAWVRHLQFDSVILHTTLLCMRWSHLFPGFKWRLRWVADLKCLKIALPQDEYDHSESLDEWLYEWGVDVIFTIFDESRRRELYPLMHQKARFQKCLTGYIAEDVASLLAFRVEPVAQRRFDIVYRATHLPYWFGSHGQLKHELGEVVASRARARGLRVDISTQQKDTILGRRWFEFLASGRCVIGCESGSSVLDRRGEVRAAVQAILTAHPGLSFDELSRRMPAGWDGHAFFAISPRHLEAVVTRTCQILVEGEYDGIFVPHEHYIPLRRDLSNVDDVLDACRDTAHVQQVADRAYRDIYLSGQNSYRELASRILEVVAERSRYAVFFPSLATFAGLARTAEVKSQTAVDRPDASHAPGVVRWFLEYPSRARIAASLLWGDWALFRLLVAYLVSYRARTAVRAVPLLNDLTVLGIVRQAQSGGLTAGDQFRVDVLLDRKSGRMTLLSRRPSDPSPRNSERMLSARMVSRLQLIAFDHSRVGNSIHHLITKRRWLNIGVPNGVIELEALARIAPECPRASLAALSMPSAGWRSRASAWRTARIRAVKGLLALYLAGTDAGLRPILMLWFSRRSVRAGVPASELAEDLLKIAIIRQTRIPRSTPAVPFVVEVQARKSHVRLVSRPGQTTPASQPVTRGMIRSITWNHAAIGDFVRYRLTKRWSIPVHVPGGRHEFKALSRIAELHPELIRDAVTTAPSQRSAWWRLSLHPLYYARKVSIAIRYGVSDPALRGLLRECRRSRIPWDRALEDVLKLGLLRAHRGFGITTSIQGHSIRIVSSPHMEQASHVSASAAGELLSSLHFSGVEWDHSAVGLTVNVGGLGDRMVVYLPSNGVHRFRTLDYVARSNPELVLRVLEPMLAHAPMSVTASADEAQPAVLGIEEMASA